MRIKLSEYAKRHGKHYTVIYNHVKKGRFKTLLQVNGHYTLDENEPYPKHKRYPHLPPRPPKGLSHNHLCHDCGTILWEVTNCPETEDHRVRGRCDDCFFKHFRDP